jgi:stearoyl-CoA desaturase (delta-9 desaturase)
MMGEGYHNNHHKHSSRANFGGVRWHEIDVTYLIMRFLNFIDIIQLKPSKVVVHREV